MVATARQARAVHSASSFAGRPTEPIPVEELVGRSFVLYCATIEPRKNHALLLRLWSRLLTRCGEVPLLVFVGRWGWRTDAVRRQIADDARLAAIVKVYPSLSDDRLQWLYRKAMFCVFASIIEGWGLGASEALDFGTPGVISDIRPLREATQTVMPAIPPANEDLWEETVARLIAEPDALQVLRREIG